MSNKKIFSFDAETDGLWGNPFSIAAIVYEKRGIMPKATYYSQHGEGDVPQEWVETDRFIAKLDTDWIDNRWVVENVLPTLESIPVTHLTYYEMLTDFSTFYMQHKQDADIICHMGYIVEANLLKNMHESGLIGDWDAPYPLLDVSGNLQQAGENPTSVDEYVGKYNLEVSDFGSTHNPLYDCEVAAKVYIHLLNRRK